MVQNALFVTLNNRWNCHVKHYHGSYSSFSTKSMSFSIEWWPLVVCLCFDCGWAAKSQKSSLHYKTPHRIFKLRALKSPDHKNKESLQKSRIFSILSIGALIYFWPQFRYFNVKNRRLRFSTAKRNLLQGTCFSYLFIFALKHFLGKKIPTRFMHDSNCKSWNHYLFRF